MRLFIQEHCDLNKLVELIPSTRGKLQDILINSILVPRNSMFLFTIFSAAGIYKNN